MQEKTFFEYEYVKVTNARFMTGGQTFAMNNVTSVKTQINKPSRLIGILIYIIGIGIAVTNPALGIAVVSAAALYMYMQKRVYHVMLTTSGGETSALKTYQLNYITKVVNGLNKANVQPY
jgi:hypothetical protein